MAKGVTKFTTKKDLQESVRQHLEKPASFEATLSSTELTKYNALKTPEENIRYKLRKMEARMKDQVF